jgi:succinyl-diaminopimelate desuccinylase
MRRAAGGPVPRTWRRVGRLTSASVDHVIIPEPLEFDRICVGHRGVYWFEVTAHGRIAHGSMPFLGANAIEHMGELLHDIRGRLQPALAARVTAMPVVPAGARHATLNINSITGGQSGHDVQSPCVADTCHAIFDRRFLPEESFDRVQGEIADVLAELQLRVPEARFSMRDLMVVHPVRTPEGSPLVASLQRGVADVVGARGSHRGLAGDVRPQARDAHRRNRALCRLRPGAPGALAPA